MEADGQLRARAQETLRQRTLRSSSEAIADPALRTQAQQFADGRMSAGEFVRYMDRSASAMRGLNRFVDGVTRLTPDELDGIGVAYARQVDQVASELAERDAEGSVSRRCAANRRDQPEEDEESWGEPESWLE
jgi:hypothetical protein